VLRAVAHDDVVMAQPDGASPGILALVWQAGALLSLCVMFHSLSLVTLGRALRRRHLTARTTFSGNLLVVVGVTTTIVSVHLVEIACWAAVYVWQGCVPDASTAFYFSAVTYTTVGYGDVVLSEGFRALAATEALTGILLSGLSTGFLFAVLSQIFNGQVASSAES